MVVDLSAINFLMPIIVFVLALLIMIAILRKIPFFESGPINWIIAVVVALIFASVSSAREYIQTVTPWFVILIVSLFFMLFIISFAQGKFEGKNWLAVVFIILLALVFLASAVKVFNFTLLPVWLLRENVLGGVLLAIIAAIVVWVVSKK